VSRPCFSSGRNGRQAPQSLTNLKVWASEIAEKPSFGTAVALSGWKPVLKTASNSSHPFETVARAGKQQVPFVLCIEVPCQDRYERRLLIISAAALAL
jgi:hypothetical protein